MPRCRLCRHEFAGPECPNCRTAAGPTVGPQRTVPAGPGRRPRPPSPSDRIVPARPTRVVRLGGGPVIEGRVLQVRQAQMPGRRDPWKVGSILLLAVALFPLAVALWVVGLSLRLALSIIGLRGVASGPGLLREVIAFLCFGALSQRPEPVPVYHYVVGTSTGRISVRQEGEFADGTVHVGNRVRLAGDLRQGVLFVREGFNESLGSRLSQPASGWRTGFFLLLIAVAFGLAALLTAPVPVR